MQTITNAHIKEINAITETVYEFKIAPKKYRHFETGQFLQLSMELVTASDIWPDSRPFSIASAWNIEEKTMRLIVKKNGCFTSKMFNELEVGSECTIKYSFGDMVFPISEPDRKIVMIAGGTGIAPFLGFVEEIKKNDLKTAKLFYSVRKEKEFIDVNELREHLGQDNLNLFCTQETTSFSENRRVEIEDIISAVEDMDQTNFYICGSQLFINYFKSELEMKGAKQIFVDEWE